MHGAKADPLNLNPRPIEFLTAQGSDATGGDLRIALRSAVEGLLQEAHRRGLRPENAVSLLITASNSRGLEELPTLLGEISRELRPAVTLAGVESLSGRATIGLSAVFSRLLVKRFEDSTGLLAVESGDLVFLSASLAGPGSDIECGVADALGDVAGKLESIGLGLPQLVSVNAFLADIGDFDRFNRAYRKFFQSDAPVRTTVAAKSLPNNPPLSLSAIAWRGKVPGGPGVYRFNWSNARPSENPNPTTSSAIRAGPIFFMSGRAGFNSEGAEAQAEETMSAFAEILRFSGLELSDVLECKVFLTVPADEECVRGVVNANFGGSVPALEVLRVPALVQERKVEITLTASAGNRPL